MMRVLRSGRCCMGIVLVMVMQGGIRVEMVGRGREIERGEVVGGGDVDMS